MRIAFRKIGFHLKNDLRTSEKLTETNYSLFLCKKKVDINTKGRMAAKVWKALRSPTELQVESDRQGRAAGFNERLGTEKKP